MNEAETRAEHIDRSLSADYVLEYRNIKLAVVEAKGGDEGLTEGAAKRRAPLATEHRERLAWVQGRR